MELLLCQKAKMFLSRNYKTYKLNTNSSSGSDSDNSEAEYDLDPRFDLENYRF